MPSSRPPLPLPQRRFFHCGVGGCVAVQHRPAVAKPRLSRVGTSPRPGRIPTLISRHAPLDHRRHAGSDQTPPGQAAPPAGSSSDHQRVSPVRSSAQVPPRGRPVTGHDPLQRIGQASNQAIEVDDRVDVASHAERTNPGKGTHEGPGDSRVTCYADRRRQTLPYLTPGQPPSRLTGGSVLGRGGVCLHRPILSRSKALVPSFTKRSPSP